jgi:16S rRNA (cytosine967-C5)-methyltransferase
VKLHFLLCEAVVAALTRIFQQGAYADKVIESTLKSNPKWGARDRAFIAGQVYEIVRYARLYWEVLGSAPESSQDWWHLLGIHLLKNEVVLPPWAEFQNLDATEVKYALKELSSRRAICESIPDWLDEVCSAELGSDWEPILHALNQPASVVLRTNFLKTTREALQSGLQQAGFDSEHVGQAGLVLAHRGNVFQTQFFKDGWFELQDASSQQVAPMLDVAPGMRVVDACAGAGGKTLHLAALMQNRGKIIALDTEQFKLDTLAMRARRAGVHIIESRAIHSSKVYKRLYGTADRLLLDVPCTGLGVLRRNPDTKWKLSKESLDATHTLQQEILTKYSPILKPGGKMVYATCSILPSENQEQIAWFLSTQAGGFNVLDEQIIQPHTSGFDGFYICLLQKK